MYIVPEKTANLARFISGINNLHSNAKAVQNVQSFRISVNGEARVFLVAKKLISKGEILYYDYNAGDLNQYPTQDFE